MNTQHATTAVARMFAAHGFVKAPEIAAELAAEVIHSRCGSCALEVLEENRIGGTKPHTVPSFRAAVVAKMNAPGHADHVEETRDAEVGRLEGRWRGEVVRQIEYVTERDRDWCVYMAARMWASGAVTPEDAATEVESVTWTGSMPRRITPNLIDAAFTYARAMAMKPPETYTDEEFEGYAAPWAAAIAEANA